MRLLGDWEERLARAPAPRPPLVVAPLDARRAAESVRVVRTAEEGISLVIDLQGGPVAALALDVRYGFAREGVVVGQGRTWRDIRSLRPLCVALAAWIEGQVVRAVIDLGDPRVLPSLRQLLRLRVPFVAHGIKEMLFALWSLNLGNDGPDVSIQDLYDTRLAAAALHLGKLHIRAVPPASSPGEAVATALSLRERVQYRLSLVGQCEDNGVVYGRSEWREEVRRVVVFQDESRPLYDRHLEDATADAEAILRVYVAQQPKVLAAGLFNHIYTIEFPFAVANARMEWRGVHVDTASRRKVRDGARRAADHYATELISLGVDPPGSDQAFHRVMERNGLIEHFKSRDGFTTKDDVLEGLESLHPAIRAFRLHRRYRYLASELWLTGALDGADGRIHPEHRQLGAATGRNTCSSPNLAGIGSVLRPVVTAPEGRSLIELDYAQIEVAVAAAEYGDQDLIDAYNTGDVYAAAAQRFYGTDLTETERQMPAMLFKRARPDLRNRMKTFVLAVLYGIQAPAIAARFGTSRMQAKRERQRFLDLFPTLRDAMDDSVAYGSCRGYAAMVSGLRRHVPYRGKPSTWTRNFLRNTPIQGSAAVVFKRALIGLDMAFLGTDVWLVMPVHDSILIECASTDADDVASLARGIMENVLRGMYPVLTPTVDVNREAPWCWNKDGHADSLDRFLADPTFRLDGVVPAGAVPVLAQRDAGPRDSFPSPEEEAFEERAAILEFEAGMAREAAERMARELLGAGPPAKPRRPHGGRRHEQHGRKLSRSDLSSMLWVSACEADPRAGDVVYVVRVGRGQWTDGEAGGGHE